MGDNLNFLNESLKAEYPIHGFNGIIFELLPKDNPFKYRLFKDISIQTIFRLTNPVITRFIILDIEGLLTLKKGFLSDGATCCPDLKSVLRASFFHDALFHLIISGLLSLKHTRASNLLFRCICKQDKMMWINRVITFTALKLFGKRHIKKIINKISKQKKIDKLKGENNAS